MRNTKFILFFLFCSVFGYVTAQQEASSSRIFTENGNIVLDFSGDLSLRNSSVGEYTIKRSIGRFGNYETIGITNNQVFVDEKAAGNPYNYYYKILDNQGNVISLKALELDLFGPNVYIYSPSDNKAEIANQINGFHNAMRYQEFSQNRYAFYFKPGDYTAADYFSISYYMHVGGLGKTPYEVKLNNLVTPPPLPDNNATCTFWRSAENFSVMGYGSLEPWESLMWATSQAAPLRRIYSQRNGFYQWEYDGWCSGGFTADCYFVNRAGSYSQQQWYTRNSYIGLGSRDYSMGGWNNAYQGVEFGPSVNMKNHSDNWDRGGDTHWENVSRVETTPVIREKPFLFIGDDGMYKVFKPSLREPDSKGISWGTNNIGEGTIYDLLEDFYVVKPGTTAETMNAHLAAGKHLFITPGVYVLSEPLFVNHPNTIILGTGYATLIPGPTNSNSAIVIGDVEGVTIASFLIEAHYNSRTLMQVGPEDAVKNQSNNPILLADLFFRVGGSSSANVNVDIALEINNSDVIGDHFWIWRADHGNGVGWFQNTSKNGLVVNGNYVTIYGLFNEHFQEYQTLWNGEMGRMCFYQCETPYDPLRQSDYMSHNGTVDGYAAYKVADHVQWHEASMMGIYDVFINTGGANIAIENSIEVPERTGVKIHHACNVCISTPGYGGFKHIINGQVKSTYNMEIADRFFIVDFSGEEPSIPFEREDPTKIENPEINETISFYPNPVDDYLYIRTTDENVRLTIYDLSGKRLYGQQGKDPIYMKSYKSEVYIIQINEKDDLIRTAKIIKK